MAQHFIQTERTDMKDAVLDLFVGPNIGQGWSRHVYEIKGQPDRVLKVEHSKKFFSNIMEWKVWEAVKDTSYSKWFAPCYKISNSGVALIQARTIPITKEQFEELTELPDFLSDTFYANFGFFEDRVVCHDYGRTNFFKLGVEHVQMVHPHTYSPSNGG